MKIRDSRNIQDIIKGDFQNKYTIITDNGKIEIHWFDLARLRLKQGWDWLNGKKTVIGGGVAFAGLVLSFFNKLAGQTVMYLGMAVGGVVGIGHKLLKSWGKYGAKGEFEKKDLVALLTDLLNIVIAIFNKLKKGE